MNKVCTICSIAFSKPPKDTWEHFNKRKICSQKCYWESKRGGTSWNKGKTMDTYPQCGFQKGNKTHLLVKRKKRSRYTHKGYEFKYVPSHPNANSVGYVREHRLVMEKIIGRFLTKEEVIHHIDGNKKNNTPENLMLFENNSKHLLYERRSKTS